MGLGHDTDRLGPPDLQVAGLQVWAHAQPLAGSNEPYDADWLTVTAHCGASGASVWVRGEILTASALERLARECDELYERLEGQAWLAADEPALSVVFAASDRSGHVSMIVEITPDHLTQAHRFEFDLDQSYLPAVARQCRTLLARFPNPHAHGERAV
jgi:glutathione S-transferase